MPHNQPYNPKGQVFDLSRLPAAVINEQASDTAQDLAGAPPNWGRGILPHISTVQGKTGSAFRVYRPPDEAIRDSLDNARFMRNECGIMECLEARQRGTALLNWHLAPEDEDSSEQADLVDQLTKILERTPDFLEYRRNLLEALWYGRYAIQNRFAWKQIGGKRQIAIGSWTPIHGDKLVFRYDDGLALYEDGQVGIRVGAEFRYDNFTHKVFGQQLNQVQPTERGLAYFLTSDQRDLLALHRHIIEDGPWEDPLAAGSIHGVGIRSRIYWTWYQMQECLSFLMEYLERSAFGIEIWEYPLGNDEAEKATRTAAEERIGGGRSIILFPRPQGEDSDLFNLRHIEPGMGGAAEVKDIIVNYFGHKIKRYILGQILTSEAEATGMGSGVSDLHLATYRDIVRYDATKLGETMTTDIVEPLKRFNFPGAEGINIRFVIDVESVDANAIMEGYERAYNMGLKIPAADVAAVIGTKTPEEDEDFLQNPQILAGNSTTFGPMGEDVAGNGPLDMENPAADTLPDPQPEQAKRFSLAFQRTPDHTNLERLEAGLYRYNSENRQFVIWSLFDEKNQYFVAEVTASEEKTPQFGETLLARGTLTEAQKALQAYLRDGKTDIERALEAAK